MAVVETANAQKIETMLREFYGQEGTPQLEQIKENWGPNWETGQIATNGLIGTASQIMGGFAKVLTHMTSYENKIISLRTYDDRAFVELDMKVVIGEHEVSGYSQQFMMFDENCKIKFEHSSQDPEFGRSMMIAIQSLSEKKE